VRYTAEIDSDDAYLCHCRMCQRATGGVAAAFAGVPKDPMARVMGWTPPDGIDVPKWRC
jgi:hypothetical protein